MRLNISHIKIFNLPIVHPLGTGIGKLMQELKKENMLFFEVVFKGLLFSKIVKL
ncbi:hypothetical protein [Arenibacter latericius]|uniref:hypothetical protein n=1 Tax=Arenibacter latericius TaxID=86104 RepID=UPI00041C7C81|nr:hypothetical protein [Arenibacter latericius]